MHLTRKQLEEELAEKGRDLEVFAQARDLIHARVVEVMDSQSPITPLPQWSGTDAVMGSLDMAIHAIERTLEELNMLLQKAILEEKPTLRLVKGSDE